MTTGDNPKDIATDLIQEHGPTGAMEEATRQVYEAQSKGRMYDLSIWREVRKILREAS